MRKLLKEPAKFLSTIQIAITLSGFLGSAFAADGFSDPLVDWLVGLGATLSRNTLDTLSVIFITLVLSYFTLIFGELVPKRIAMKKSEALALKVSGIVSGRVVAKIVDKNCVHNTYIEPGFFQSHRNWPPVHPGVFHNYPDLSVKLPELRDQLFKAFCSMLNIKRQKNDFPSRTAGSDRAFVQGRLPSHCSFGKNR